MTRVMGGVSLIAGTCIGAATLVLPITLSSVGILGSIVVLLVFWLVMYGVSLLIYEVNSCLPIGSSYLSMAGMTLGKSGWLFTWFSFILVLYSLLAAYLVGLSDLSIDLMHRLPIGDHYSFWLGVFPWLVGIVVILYGGSSWVDAVNRVMLIGLVLTFVPLCIVLAQHVTMAYFHLYVPTFKQVLMVTPILITAFGYQVVLPSVRNHCEQHQANMCKVIAWGSFIPFVVYTVWTAMILSVLVPTGEHSLQAILMSGKPASELPHVLEHIWHSRVVYYLMDSFEFFALASSFLGIALSMYDLLADGCQRIAWLRRRECLIILTVLPACIYAGCYPHGFIMALGYAGVFVAILNGIIPVMMSIRVRIQRHHQHYRVPAVGWIWLSVIGVVASVLWAEYVRVLA